MKKYSNLVPLLKTILFIFLSLSISHCLWAQQEKEKVDKDGNTELLAAIRRGHQQMVQWLLKKGANPNAEDVAGDTPLIWAVRLGKKKMVKMLLDAGAEPQRKNNLNRDALHEALEAKKFDIATLLAVHPHSDLDSQDNLGLTPLHLSIKVGDERMIQLLLDKGANIHLPDYSLKTPLHHAVEAKNPAVQLKLLQAKAKVDSRDKDGRTPLILASLLGQMELIPPLLTSGADLNAQEYKNKESALMIAVSQLNLPLMEMLLSAGANKELRDARGDTALLRSMGYKNYPVLLKLLEHGANPKAFNRRLTAYDRAVKDSKWDLAYVLKLFETLTQLPDGIPLAEAAQKLWDFDFHLNMDQAYQMNLVKQNIIQDMLKILLKKNPYDLGDLQQLYGFFQKNSFRPSASFKEFFIRIAEPLLVQHLEQSYDRCAPKTSSPLDHSTTTSLQELNTEFFCFACMENVTTNKKLRLNSCQCKGKEQAVCQECFVTGNLVNSQKGNFEPSAYPVPCPFNCGGELDYDELKKLGFGSNDSYTYRKRVLENRLSKFVPGWKFCPNPKGCLNGKVVGHEDADTEQFFDCSLCLSKYCMGCGQEHSGPCESFEKEKESLNKLVEAGKRKRKKEDPTSEDGRYRACFWCGKLTERRDGCNSMKCDVCGEEWHWNYGDHKVHPHYKGRPVHDFDDDEQRYEPRVPAHF